MIIFHDGEILKMVFIAMRSIMHYQILSNYLLFSVEDFAFCSSSLDGSYRDALVAN